MFITDMFVTDHVHNRPHSYKSGAMWFECPKRALQVPNIPDIAFKT